jgi:hypothetical protein
MAVGAADAITAVSAGTHEQIVERIPAARAIVRDAVPLGWDRNDFACLGGTSSQRFFEERDGFANIVYVGTVLPNGLETLRAILQAAARIRSRDAGAYDRLRLWFLGTSNQFDRGTPARVMPIAAALGVTDIVREVPPRIPYAQTLAVLHDARAILLLGSTEPHYTASKLYPALLADRPILAAFHEASSVIDILSRVGGGTAVRLVSYGNGGPGTQERIDCLTRHLTALVREPARRVSLDLRPIEDVSAKALAKKLCAILDRVREH